MDEPQAEPRNWQSLIEEQIARLDLDNLPGKGKPLDLSANPFVTPDEAMAQRLLKNAGFTLPWIDEGRQIDAEIEAARRKLQQAHDEYLTLRDAQICAGHQWVEGAWQAALREFRQEVARINRRIRDYNLKAPSLSVHKFSVRVDEELARLGVASE
ncbi:MAG: DUF1992 domain-containing protein, partial [Caldilineales bacterium]|nr:DUF1992 domain-containing protein [Caldilineales bacterium]